MQIFILLYIEAGSYIDVDQSWDFAVLWVNLLTVGAELLTFRQIREEEEKVRPCHISFHWIYIALQLLLLP